MAVIRAAHYGETEARLMEDPIVIAMAMGLANTARKELVHDDGETARFEFTQSANAEYRARGGTDGGHVGAVSAALLKLLDSGVAPPTKIVNFHVSRDSKTAWRDEDVAMTHVGIYSGDDEDAARRALAEYLVGEATDKIRGKYASEESKERGKRVLALLSEVLTDDFEGAGAHVILRYETDNLVFRFVRTERDA